MVEWWKRVLLPVVIPSGVGVYDALSVRTVHIEHRPQTRARGVQAVAQQGVAALGLGQQDFHLLVLVVVVVVVCFLFDLGGGLCVGGGCGGSP